MVRGLGTNPALEPYAGARRELSTARGSDD